MRSPHWITFSFTNKQRTDTMYTFTIIPPFKATAEASNLSGNVLGVEVTVKALADRCNLGNLDHHGPGDTSATPAACEQAMWVDLPPIGTAIIGVLGDPDTLTAMAVLKCRSEGFMPPMAYIKPIGMIDRLGPHACPSAMSLTRVQAIRAIAADRSMSTAQAVELIAKILEGSCDWSMINGMIEAHAAELAMIRDRVTYLEVLDGICAIESPDMGALSIGYEYADVIIARNPAMLLDRANPAAGTYTKYTICKRNEHVRRVLDYDALNAIEGAEGGRWDGRTTIGGSPQGFSSTLTFEQVAACLKYTPEE